MGKVKASVVVPVFHTEPYLRRCIESLLGQTRSDFEIIVVDDASTGNAKAIVESFQLVQPEIKYVRHPSNLGVLSARFTGADHNSGDYVGFLDSDDTARPHFIERLLATAAESGADIVGSAKNERTQGAYFLIEGPEAILNAYAQRQITNWAVWTKIYRKALLSSLEDLRRIAGTETIERGEDLLFNVFCALKGPKYANIPDVLVNYTRGRTGSITNPDSPERRRKGFRSSMRTYEILHEAVRGFEKPIETVISRSAKNAYRLTLGSGDEGDIAWAREVLSQSPVGDLVLTAIFEAADDDRRLLIRNRSELREMLFEARRHRDEWRNKAGIQREERQKIEALRQEETHRRQRLRAILADLLGWIRRAIRG